jgi:deoxyribodipyrimidine photo-lyase
MSTFKAGTAILWLRNDLRLSDNAALLAACQHEHVVLLYIYDDKRDRALGAAKKWWLHQALKSLGDDISSLNQRLILRSGDEKTVLNEIVTQTNATAVYWNRRYEPTTIGIDQAIKADLGQKNITAVSFAGHLLHEPTKIRTKAGTPFRVFTPFWRNLEGSLFDIEPPLPRPEEIPATSTTLQSDELNAWNLTPNKPNWATTLADKWQGGEQAALTVMDHFLSGNVQTYQAARDFPAIEGTSMLSPYLTFGEISARQVWCASMLVENGQPFRRQLAWRDFSYHLLIHNPHIAKQNYNPAFNQFPWIKDDALLTKWKKGQTGYPIVDAGMRELWKTGYMHNRVRMIVASFLTKHLMIDWREGELWFWDTLVDADPANNTAGWQWVAGSGADASPYYRIFNPIIQGKKFDPLGDYVKKHVPELSKLDAKYIHTPWEAPNAVLSKASITLGVEYPKPIVEHSFARERALKAYGQMKDAA